MAKNGKKNGNGVKNGKSETALAVVDNTFSMLAIPEEEIQSVVAENLGAEGINSFDLERIKLPAGGGSSWEIPTLEEGETDTVKFLEGVVVFQKTVRAYWEISFDEGGSAPPDCKSSDAIQGDGEPGGFCRECPFAKFGSAVNKDGSPAKGQACKQMLLLFLLGENSFLPQIIVCPPTSISPMRKFSIKLTSRAIPLSSVLVRLAIESDKNTAGIKYSKIAPSLIGQLNDTEKANIKTYVRNLKSAWEQEGIKDNDYEPSGENGDTSFNPSEIENE